VGARAAVSDARYLELYLGLTLAQSFGNEKVSAAIFFDLDPG
jgi:hypothetical protein